MSQTKTLNNIAKIVFNEAVDNKKFREDQNALAWSTANNVEAICDKLDVPKYGKD